MSKHLDLDDVCAGNPKAQTELDALRAQVAALTHQNASYKMLTDSQEKRIGYLTLNCRELDEARKTLESEREANERLTLENHALTEERDAAFAMSKCECGAEEACRNIARLRDALGKAREALLSYKVCGVTPEFILSCKESIATIDVALNKENAPA